MAASHCECLSAMQACAVLAVHRCIMTSVACFVKELALFPLGNRSLGVNHVNHTTQARTDVACSCCRCRHAGCGPLYVYLRHTTGQAGSVPETNWQVSFARTRPSLLSVSCPNRSNFECYIRNPKRDSKTVTSRSLQLASLDTKNNGQTLFRQSLSVIIRWAVGPPNKQRDVNLSATWPPASQHIAPDSSQ